MAKRAKRDFQAGYRGYLDVQRSLFEVLGQYVMVKKKDISCEGLCSAEHLHDQHGGFSPINQYLILKVHEILRVPSGFGD